MRPKVFLLLIFFGSNLLLYSQNKILDSLFQVLKTAPADTTRINTYSALCWEYQKINPDTAIYFANLGLKLAVKAKYKKGMAACYNNNGIVHMYQGTYHKAIEYYIKALKIYEELGDKKGMAKCYNNIGLVHMDQGTYPKALEYYLKALKINEELGNKKGMAGCYSNIGSVHYFQGTYPKALEYFLKALKINEELGDKNGTAICYNNIGGVHMNQGTYPKAIEYYLKSLKIFEKLGDKKGISNSYLCIGSVHRDQGNYIMAIEYYLKSLKITEELGDKNGMSACYNNIGNVHLNQGNYPKAIEYYLKSLKICEELGNKNGIAAIWGNIASLHITLADSMKTDGKIASGKTLAMTAHYNQAVEFGLKVIELAKEIKAMPLEKNAANNLMTAYEKLGNYKASLKYAGIFIAIKDSMFKEEKTKALAGMEAKFQNEKNMLQIEKLGKEKELQLSENKKQKIVIWFTVLGLLLIIVFAVFVINRLRITRKQKKIIEEQKHTVDEAYEELNQQNEEISSQRDEIEAQRDTVTIQKNQIEKIHHEVSQSIDYATRIQTSILPDTAFLNKYLSDNFVLFRPKDKVSGDFYWWALVENHLIITVADCTGHGVPGAFMSMLGTSFLREIVVKEYMTNPAIILKRLRKEIIHALKQSSEHSEQKDGMDMAIIVINLTPQLSEGGEKSPLGDSCLPAGTVGTTYEMQFAGANNPCWIVASHQSSVVSQFTELKPDKMPVAIYDKMNPFTNQEYKLQKGDIIYLMSDGYEDQFGGEKNKKFMSKNLKNLLATNSQKPMAEQKEILNKTIEDWMNGQEQIDDITVLGIKI